MPDGKGSALTSFEEITQAPGLNPNWLDRFWLGVAVWDRMGNGFRAAFIL